MKHLKIQYVGHFSTARPTWPMQRYEQGYYEAPDIHYTHEPLLGVEIAKSDWDAMFDLYEEHMAARRHPAVQHAWEQYQMVKHLTNKK